MLLAVRNMRNEYAVFDIADRQKAHSVTLAIKAAVEPIPPAKREQELYRETLAFSISHEYRAVRI
ncbi:hypothetical protein EMPG_10892 [Blastomyces silverae]|uniref:DUF7924 domain-containing protein n=1 Tax=Blastomyces silverae TaxID=2060906 RepID=A0A0H1B2Q4_9EURO|nr:hypothetical protein EMPG_10892 [Blastomyces silverae]